MKSLTTRNLAVYKIKVLENKGCVTVLVKA